VTLTSERIADRIALSTPSPQAASGLLAAVAALSGKWRTPGQKTDSDDFFAAIEAIDAAWQRHNAPTHRHKKRGTEYVLIGIGKMQADSWFVKHRYGMNAEGHGTDILGPSVDMREVAIYRSVDDGSLWARPREEFEDGRFETLPRSTTGGAK